MAFLPDGRMLITERPGRLADPRQGKASAAGNRDADGMGAAGRRPVRRRRSSGYVKNGWIYLSLGDAARLQSACARPCRRSRAAGTRWSAEPAVDDRIVRGKIRDNAWVDQQVIFNGAPESTHRPTSTTVRASSSTARATSSTRSETRASSKARRICRTHGQDPPRQRRWLGTERQSVRETPGALGRSGATGIATRRASRSIR